MNLQIKDPANCPFRIRRDTKKTNGWNCAFDAVKNCADVKVFPAACPLLLDITLTANPQKLKLYTVYAYCVIGVE